MEKIKSSWMVSYQYINGIKLYSVYRLKDVNEVDHSGNRETRGGFFEDREDAEEYARILNGEIEIDDLMEEDTDE